MNKIVTVLGARPQFIKAAPVSRALAAQGIAEVLVHTGQHFDPNMSKVFFDELELRSPDYSLGVHGGGHGTMTGRMLLQLEPLLEREKPDAVLVYGDTNSTLAGALAAVKLYLPVAHVEAGLRSFQNMPEEINRILTDRVSRWLFCPTTTAVENLAREGIARGVSLVGDVMYDSCVMMCGVARDRSDVLARLSLEEGSYQLATVHRAENTGDKSRLAVVLEYLDGEASRKPVILVLHPRTRAAAAAFDLSFGRVRVVNPLGYLDMLRLLEGCACVLTDSGGLQKEAYFLRRPCVTLRDTTEWPETLNAGWNRLWKGPDYLPRQPPSGFGMGDAATRIAASLAAAPP